MELIEQPLPDGDREGYDRLHAARLPLPIIWDESCHTLPDVAAPTATPTGSTSS